MNTKNNKSTSNSRLSEEGKQKLKAAVCEFLESQKNGNEQKWVAWKSLSPAMHNKNLLPHANFNFKHILAELVGENKLEKMIGTMEWRFHNTTVTPKVTDPNNAQNPEPDAPSTIQPTPINASAGGVDTALQIIEQQILDEESNYEQRSTARNLELTRARERVKSLEQELGEINKLIEDTEAEAKNDTKEKILESKKALALLKQNLTGNTNSNNTPISANLADAFNDLNDAQQPGGPTPPPSVEELMERQQNQIN